MLVQENYETKPHTHKTATLTFKKMIKTKRFSYLDGLERIHDMPAGPTQEDPQFSSLITSHHQGSHVDLAFLMCVRRNMPIVPDKQKH